METLKDFVERFCSDVGCYSKKNQQGNRYSLKKYNSDLSGHMGVFGWVTERITKDAFVISTYKYLADTQAIAAADKERLGAQFISKGKDPKGKATGLSYLVRRNSRRGSDYQKAVQSLRVVRKNR